MLQAMYNGVSAIQATQEDMDVIGNNIANVDTTAYKSSTVTFADQLSQTIQGASAPTSTVGGTDPIQTGTGVRVGSISTVLSQGSLLSTSSPTDLAIQGNGYFTEGTASTGITYSRDGHFALDSNGDLVNATTGAFVLGWTVTGTGTLNTNSQITPTSSIQIGIGQATAVQATANIDFNGNLSADAAAGATYSTNEEVYDSLGEEHSVTLTFTRGTDPVSGDATNTWSWTASGDPTLTTPAGTVNQGTITFNSTGGVASATGTLELNPTNGATSPQDMNVNFANCSQVTGSSTVQASNQDGYPAGSLESFAIDDAGKITGTYSNGLTRTIGQVALANFSNPDGLNSIGNNQYTASPNSGNAVIGTAGNEGLGSISAGYLEQSNVDLGAQLSNMVVVQNAFEANTKIVTAVNQMLGTLVQMNT